MALKSQTTTWLNLFFSSILFWSVCDIISGSFQYTLCTNHALFKFWNLEFQEVIFSYHMLGARLVCTCADEVSDVSHKGGL